MICIRELVSRFNRSGQRLSRHVRWVLFGVVIFCCILLVLIRAKSPHASVLAPHPTPLLLSTRSPNIVPASLTISKDPWLGVAPPTPGPQVVMTPAYRSWRLTFAQAIAHWATQKNNRGLAQALQQWFTVYEAQANSGRLNGGTISPLFSHRQVRTLLSPPPQPSYMVITGYKVVLPWNGAVYQYTANPVPANQPYLLHPDGIRDGGVPLRERSDVAQLFARAGVDDSCAQNVLLDVSRLEGGFDAVNTWDTGYVSVGCIQFITGATGEGSSLIQVLTRMKDNEARLAAYYHSHRSEFASYFTDHGIDARNGALFVRDPMTGVTHTGAEAVELIIHDKRLTAIFQDAGAKSTAFQVAQIREAYGAYYLARETFRIPVAEVSDYTSPTTGTLEQTTPATKTPDTTPATTSINTTTPPALPVNAPICTTHYVYGAAALQLLVTHSSRGAASARNARSYQQVRRLPDLVGCYGDIFPSERGRLILTDRAVQHGVRNATETCAEALNSLPQYGQPFTIASLRAHEIEYLQLIQNRVPVEIASK